MQISNRGFSHPMKGNPSNFFKRDDGSATWPPDRGMAVGGCGVPNRVRTPIRLSRNPARLPQATLA
jgi:hypothetical protein